ncbi:MAG: FAD-dependent oxidoreductase [Acidimicrobiales bacterium]
MKVDTVVIGAGTAGIVSASILASSGRSVALVERQAALGGRSRHWRHKGHELGLGSHLVEDPGDSLTRVCELMNVPLEHSQRSDSMPFWDRDGWKPIQEHYAGASKEGLKRCIEALIETPWSELDRWDHASLREWMAQYTSDEGVFLVWEAISMLEQITTHPWEHSASENLYVRKLHYSLKRTAGYSFYPLGGWDRLWKAMADAFTTAGGTLLQKTKIERVIVENRTVRGVRLADGSTIEADNVVATVPVWNLPPLFDEGALPFDLLERIRLLKKNGNRACWLGYWIAAKEPVIAMTEREMASFFATPRTGLPGFTLNFTGYDPSVSPDGEYLTCVGAAFDAVAHYGDKAWIDKKFRELWLDIEDMLPAAKRALWKKPHLVTTYGVINKPGLVGAVRPDAVVRGVDGLFLAGDTTRSRGVGIDKAARTGITAAEAVLGRRHEHFADTVRY